MPPAAPASATPTVDHGARLREAMSALRAQAILPMLAAAIEAVNAGRTAEALDLVSPVLKSDPDCGLAWHVLALCRERGGDLNGALSAYETALSLDPEDVDIANDLGRLAMQMGQAETAVELFALYARKRPGDIDGANNLGCALRDLMRYSEAIDILRPAIEAHPESALLWNTLATVVAEEGEVDRSAVFFDEALRLDPGFAKARYNRANIRLALGDPDGALTDCEAALAAPALTETEAAMMRFARATMLLAAGRTGQGWDAYDARLDARLADVTHFAADPQRWRPDEPLEGRRLLVSGEQGLGDEVLFANVLPDVVEALGPRGELALAVERRLAPLFQRSFPSAEVSAHATYRVEHQSVRTFPAARGAGSVAARADLWTPMASLLARFRMEVRDFPARASFLRPDPARVAHWRGRLADLGPGLKVGVVWKSLKLNSQRARFFSPFQAWAPVLTTPGVRFVNLQYGDCEPEFAWAREALGVEVWSPPGLDLKDDLDDLAALSAALDLAMGPANASLNIAAACGAPAWFVSTPGAWPLLGTAAYPWYPRARVFSPRRFNAWEAVMAEIAAALRQEVALHA